VKFREIERAVFHAELSHLSAWHERIFPLNGLNLAPFWSVPDFRPAKAENVAHVEAALKKVHPVDTRIVPMAQGQKQRKVG
jgi:hypothetical protein